MNLKKTLSMIDNFNETPINKDDEIEEPFLDFAIGTDRIEIWHWFEEQCNNFSMGKYLNGYYLNQGENYNG